MDASHGRWQRGEKLLDTLQYNCLRKIFKIFWPEKISNEVEPISHQTKIHRWKWINTNAHPRTACTWTTEGKRKRERSKETWRRTVERKRDFRHGHIKYNQPNTKICGEVMSAALLPWGEKKLSQVHVGQGICNIHNQFHSLNKHPS